MMKIIRGHKITCIGLLIGALALITACGSDSSTVSDTKSSPETASENDTDKQALIYNREASIPPQCYTNTKGIYNPCYTCHQSYGDDRPNVQNDIDLQGDYAFSWLGVKNHWLNFYIDRREKIAEISDDEITEYVSQDNYSALKKALKSDPEWKGYIPDLENLQNSQDAFDEKGLAKDGSAWVAFNYKPLPSTFWATNGSTDDVIIRLPEEFRISRCVSTPEANRDVYFANLALLEANIKGLNSIGVPDLDENNLCADLNADGVLSKITSFTQLPDHYLGEASSVSREAMLYPLGTEFLHTVRYVGVSKSGEVYTPPRMKELRYMRKTHYFTKGELKGAYALEVIDKEDQIISNYTNTGYGLKNKFGWLVLGFIENEHGDLRQQTHEENKFCMGCHSTIGTTIDQTFAFPRKVSGEKGWGYIDLKGMKDVPNKGESKGEIFTYLERVGGGSEFRANTEMQQRWFNPDGTIKTSEVEASDVYTLTTPSKARALALNKAYRTIVKEQSYIYGRDSIISPPQNLYKKIPVDVIPLTPENRYQWDIRLQW